MRARNVHGCEADCNVYSLHECFPPIGKLLVQRFWNKSVRLCVALANTAFPPESSFKLNRCQKSATSTWRSVIDETYKMLVSESKAAPDQLAPQAMPGIEIVGFC
jgi:hypothetical protein